MTSPEGMVLLDVVVTVPTTSPAPVMALEAAACVSPTTFGTGCCLYDVRIGIAGRRHRRLVAFFHETATARGGWGSLAGQYYARCDTEDI